MAILRIVRMEFHPEKVQEFMTIFNASKFQIRGFSGCTYLAIYTDAVQENVKYTYSLWESAANLEAYRNSALFKSTWASTKVLFQAKPQVFSLAQPNVVVLPEVE